MLSSSRAKPPGHLLALLALVTLLAGLVGCGNKGDLYRPEQATTESRSTTEDSSEDDDESRGTH